LQATVRKELGKGPSRRLRQQGLIPAVVYGPRMDSTPVAVDPLDVRRILSSGENVIVELKIRDGQEVHSRLVMVKDYTVHPVKGRLWHADLYEISLEEAIRVEVPIHLTGTPEGALYGGILSPLLRTLEISCLPEQIPEHIEVDCSSMKVGDTLHVSDLRLPAEISVITDPSTAVVTVSAPAVEAAPAAAPAEEEVPVTEETEGA
jgi:large subunit ribosomal protein L25